MTDHVTEAVRKIVLTATRRAYLPTSRPLPYICGRCLCDLAEEDLGTSCGEPGCPAGMVTA